MNHSDDTQDFELLGLDVLPEGWKYMPLGELVDSRRGISYGIVQPGEHVDVGVPIVRVNNLQSGRIESNDIMKVSYEIEKKYQRTRLKGGEVLLSLVGSLGQTAVVSKDILGWNVARAIAVIPVNPEIEPEWVNFALRSPLLQHYIHVWATTTVQATLNLGDVVRLPIPIPPEKERKVIIDILGPLDDKIELNRRMNGTLEFMARAVFRKWFVESEEVGAWEVGKIKDVCEKVENGGTPRRDRPEYWEPATIPWLTSGEVRQEIIISTENKISEQGYKNSSAKMWGKGTTVVALYGATAGEVSFVAYELCANQACCGLIPNDGWKYFIYLTLSASENSLASQARGSAQQNLSQQIVADFSIRKPDEKRLDEFNQIIAPMFDKWIGNLKESRTLASLRDSLLPRLMRGEIKVKE